MSLATGFHTSHGLAGKLTAFIKMLTFYRHRSQTGVFDMLRNLPPCSSRYLCVVAYLNRQFQFICCSEKSQLMSSKSAFKNCICSNWVYLLSSRVQADSLRELVGSAMDAQESLFMKKYFPMYISAAIDQMEKHDVTFLQQASSGEPVAVRGTNRSVETGIGKTKNQLKRNPKTRALLLQAKLQVCQFDKDAVASAMLAHSERFKLKKKARVLHSAMPTSLSFEMDYLAKHERMAGPVDAGSVEDVTLRLMMQYALIRLEINMDGKITIGTLSALLRYFEEEPLAGDEFGLMNQAIPCVYNYTSTTLRLIKFNRCFE